MLSPYSIPPNSIKRIQKISNRKQDLERPQLTSNDLERPQMTSSENDKPVSKKVKTKNILAGGDPNDNSNNGKDLMKQDVLSN